MVRRSRTYFIGETAKGILHAGFKGTVLSAGSKASYVLGDEGDVIGISTLAQSLHTRFLLTDTAPKRLAPGLKAWCDKDTLLFANGEGIDLHVESSWSGTCPGELPINSIDVLVRNILELLDVASDLHQGENLGQALKVLKNVLTQNTESDSAYACASLFISVAMEPIRRIAEACHIGQPGTALGDLESLIGLGQGLTPSGDDFLGGLLFAFWHLNKAYPTAFEHDEAIANRLLGLAATETNRISYALLTDFASGQGPKPLHDLMDMMMAGNETSGLKGHVLQIIDIGHSSGWDSLTGFITGLILAARFRDN